MIRLINVPAHASSLDFFGGIEGLKDFLSRHGCRGIELIRSGDEAEFLAEEGLIQGVHLLFYTCMMDLILEDRQALLAEYGDEKCIKEIYGGLDRRALIESYRQELDFAQQAGAKYVVFHVTEATLEECFTYRYKYTPQQVIDENCALINELLEGQNYTFDFLMENLWRPGLSFTDPTMTKRLLEGVNYRKKGIMLDIGHLMNTNLSLKSQEEGCQYIHQMLDEHGDLCSYIKGIHLHQSISGEYAQRVIDNPPPMKKGYYERFAQTYEHICRVDRHLPLTCPGTRQLVERINPEYLVLELSRGTKQEYEQAVGRQCRALQQE